ncbi:MAG: hypothetical protein ABI778_08020 [Ignavibacteriota bacterium]
MPEINYDQLEESLRRAHKKSLGRFIMFLAFVLILWIGTYFATKGQFSFFTKKIAVTDTLVVDQSAALQSKDSTIAQLLFLDSVLTDSIRRISAKISRPLIAPPPDKTVDQTSILQKQIANRRVEQRKRDSLLEIKIDMYNRDYPNQLNQMAIPPKKR